MYYVRKMKLGKTEQLDSLSLAAGELYTKTLVGFWRPPLVFGMNRICNVACSNTGKNLPTLVVQSTSRFYKKYRRKYCAKRKNNC